MEALSINLWPFFVWLMQTTAQASLLIFLIFLVRLILRTKLGARWHYYLWLLLLIRLVLPWAPESRVSIFNLFRMSFERGAIESVTGNSTTITTNAFAGNQGLWGNFVNMLPLIWLAGVLVLLCYLFFSNLVFWISVNRKRPSSDKSLLELMEKCKSQMGIRTSLIIIVTDKVKSPALGGFLRPVLLLPVGMKESLSPEELRHVFLHELAHLKRHDVFVAHFVCLVQILHWFNPLVWLAFYRMRTDRELACDALVLSKMNLDEPKKYGRTIISLLELFNQNRHLPAMVGIMEDKLQLKRRIKMIAKFKKVPKKWSLIAVFITAVIAAMALTNAKSSSKKDDEIRDDTPTAWVGYPEANKATNPPQVYVGHGNPDGDNVHIYVGSSQDGDKPITRGSMRTSHPRQSNSEKNAPVFYGVSYERSAPIGGIRYGDHDGDMGGYAPAYGGIRVKDTKESDSPDSNTPALTP
jgi:bla regulator protein BlaR1